MDRAVLCCGGLWFVNLVNFMDGLDWMTVAEVVPVTAAVAIIGAFGLLPRGGDDGQLGYCAAPCSALPISTGPWPSFSRRCRQHADRLAARMAARATRRPWWLAAAILLPLYYLADSTITLIRRAINGEKVWQAHRSHFYQRATDRGFTVGQVVAYVFAVNIALAALASVTLAAPGRLNEAAALLCGAALVGWLLFAFARVGAGRRAAGHVIPEPIKARSLEIITAELASNLPQSFHAAGTVFAQLID